MKNQAEIYQALLDGKTVEHRAFGNLYIKNGTLYDEHDIKQNFGFSNPENWHIYTEPTEYEVALYDVWTGSAWFRTSQYYKDDKAASREVACAIDKDRETVVKRTNITQIVKTDD